MPWLPDGTFQRTNEDFNGVDVWEKDRDALIKIIAERHDFHDQDLATGIEQCLNVNGLNQLLTDLNMGGNKIENLGAPVSNTDAASLGYTFGSIDYSGTTLTVRNRLGALLDSTTIPAGLSDAPADSKTYGRNNGDWVEVTGGGGGYASDIQASATTIDVTVSDASTAGSSATIQAAVADVNAGVMSAAQAKQLADLVAAGTGGGMIPPIKLRGVPDGVKQTGLYLAVEGWTEEFLLNTANNTWKDIFNINGSGTVNYLGITISAILSATDVDAELFIDGVSVWNKDSLFTAAGWSNGDGVSIIGEVDASTPPDLKSFQQIYFSSNITLRIKTNVASSSSYKGVMRWVQYS